MNLTREQLAALTLKGSCKVVSGLHDAAHPLAPQRPLKAAGTPAAWVGAPSETQLQQAVIKWWSIARLQFFLDERYLMAIPQQAKRTKQNASRMHREGLRPGVSDLFLAVPKAGIPGLWLEMKTATGTLSSAQREFGQLMQAKGYAFHVCRSTNDACEVITAYLKSDLKRA